MLWSKLLGAGGLVGAGGAGISYVGGTVVIAPGSDVDGLTIDLTTLSGGSGGAPIAGDTVVVIFSTHGTSDLPIGVATSGYTELADLFADDTYNNNFWAGFKQLGATPDTEVVTTPSGSEFLYFAVVVHVLRGVSTSSPLDVAVQTASTVNTVRPNPPSVTSVTDGAVILAAGGGVHLRGAANFSASDLTSFLSDGYDSNVDVSVGAGLYFQEVAGTFDPALWSFSSSDASTSCNNSMTVAFRPA